MSYSKDLGSALTNTKLRTPKDVSTFSGMCSVCTATCAGSCEIGLSAIRGSEAIFPTSTNKNQIASEKNYPLDFSHFNINGRVFGTQGCNENVKEASYPNVNIETGLGKSNEIRLKAPIILPAISKLNWKDYYAGAALAGVVAVIGEDVVAKDSELILEGGKVKSSPLLKEMVSAYRIYQQQDFGDIVLQANIDDDYLGVLEYAIKELDIKSVEIKLGQAAKGIQGLRRIEDINEALKFQQMGYIIYPDPSDIKIAENYRKGNGPVFEKIGKLPLWNEDTLRDRIEDLRKCGAERICLKAGPYDPKDLIKIIKIASLAKVDLITFDGSGGGSGNSPVKMMNEWGIPTVYLEKIVYDIMSKLDEKGYDLPHVAIAGGFAMEDQVFKGLSLGAPYINLVGIGRAAMAAAMVGKHMGDLIRQKKVPKEFKQFGSSLEEIFEDAKIIKEIYGQKISNIPPGAIGLYSYIQRISVGLQQLMALNRKFSLKYIDREDIIPLTDLASQITGLETATARLQKELRNI